MRSWSTPCLALGCLALGCLTLGCAQGGDAIPRVPTGLTAAAGNRAVTLDWQADENVQYHVYFATNVSVTAASSKLTASAPHAHQRLANDTPVYYRIAAFNNVGESALSEQVTATPRADATSPGAPASVTAVGGNGQITVSWGEIPGVTSYTVYRDTKPGVFPDNGTSLSTPKPPLVDSGLASGVTYHYVVTAWRANVESLPSAEVSARADGVITPPPPGLSAPTNLTAQPGDAQVKLSWSAVSGATSYTVYFATQASVTPQNGTALTNARSPHTHGGLSNGTTVHYVVVAHDANGTSAPSAPASATPKGGVVVPPTVNGNLSGSLSAGAYAVVVLENLSGGTGLVQLQVYSSDPKGAPPGQLVGGLSVIASSAISGALPAKAGQAGIYENVTPGPLAAGTYVFSVSGSRSGRISLTVNKLARCSISSPSQGAAHTAGTDLSIAWSSQNSEKAQILLKDVLGTVTYPPQVPDPGGVIIPGNDIPNKGALDALVSAVWSVKIADAGAVFLGDCAVRVNLQ